MGPAFRFGLSLVLVVAGIATTLYVVGRNTPAPTTAGRESSRPGSPATTAPPASATPPRPSAAAPTFPAFAVDPSYTCTLEAGAYGGRFGNVRVSITTPTTWHGLVSDFHVEDQGCGGGGGVRLEVTVVSEVYADICRWAGTGVDVRAPDAMTVAFADSAAFEATGPTAIELGGRPAYRYELTLPADLDRGTCSGGLVQFWRDPARDERSGPTTYEPGSLDVYFVKVRKVTLGVYAYKGEDWATPEMRAELDAVVASLRFEVD